MAACFPVLLAMCVRGAMADELAATAASERVYKNDKGRVLIIPIAMPDADKNPWTPELEEGFIERAKEAINRNKGRGYGTLYFENEKRTYPLAMMDFLAGNRAPALKILQADDTEGYNKYTNMVDFYPCFTLKGQMRFFLW